MKESALQAKVSKKLKEHGWFVNFWTTQTS